MPDDQGWKCDARCIEVERRLIGRRQYRHRRSHDHPPEPCQGRLEAGCCHRRNAAVAGSDHPDGLAPAGYGGVDETLQFRSVDRVQAISITEATRVRRRGVCHHDVKAVAQKYVGGPDQEVAG